MKAKEDMRVNEEKENCYCMLKQMGTSPKTTMTKERCHAAKADILHVYDWTQREHRGLKW